MRICIGKWRLVGFRIEVAGHEVLPELVMRIISLALHAMCRHMERIYLDGNRFRALCKCLVYQRVYLFDYFIRHGKAALRCGATVYHDIAAGSALRYIV